MELCRQRDAVGNRRKTRRFALGSVHQTHLRQSRRIRSHAECRRRQSPSPPQRYDQDEHWGSAAEKAAKEKQTGTTTTPGGGTTTTPGGGTTTAPGGGTTTTPGGPTKPTEIPKPKPLTRAQLLAKALKLCKKEHKVSARNAKPPRARSTGPRRSTRRNNRACRCTCASAPNHADGASKFYWSGSCDQSICHNRISM